MLINRIKALERRFQGIRTPPIKDLRIVYQFDGDPEPEEGPDENLLVIRVVDTRGDKVVSKVEADNVIRSGSGAGEGHKRRPNNHR